ncbi:MAG: glycoside hydrolase family 73 protein [Oscillospiraceae bacterium]|nr:glycoside hydrolase family 73 protein [Oscillospiraceae bacterium]
MKHTRRYLRVLLACVLCLCGFATAASAAGTSQLSQAQRDFIGTVGAMATADMQQSGVLASLTVAQAILESGWGTSELARNANALFGIKADSRWSGPAYSKVTQEWYGGGRPTQETALFRAYDSWQHSISDHSAFLRAGSRYAAVIGERDYRRACNAIQQAGYATDPGYAANLIRLIETYGLTAYDGAYDGNYDGAGAGSGANTGTGAGTWAGAGAAPGRACPARSLLALLSKVLKMR